MIVVALCSHAFTFKKGKDFNLLLFFFYFFYLSVLFIIMRFRLLLLSVLLISVESKHIKTKVVILGAGASGISAARAFSNAGMEDYVIVDAQSFIGGSHTNNS